MRNLANYITLLRMIFCLLLLFLYPFSIPFYIVYLLCGLSDILDGYIARKFKIQTEFGARFDSMADIVFIVCASIRMIPSLFYLVDIKLWMFAFIILIVKCLSMGLIAIKHSTFGMIHSTLNKVAGFSLLVAPFFVHVVDKNFLVALLCLICSIAALEEILINILHTDLDLNRKSLYHRYRPRKIKVVRTKHKEKEMSKERVVEEFNNIRNKYKNRNY